MSNILSRGFILITIIYLLSIFLMLPLRDLSFGDDFAYINTADRFYKTGELRISDWASATSVFPALWGGAFTHVFGFSIKILHLSNIILFYFGTIAFYFTLKNLNITELKSVVFTLFLLFYPWVFFFIFTTMTDVYYLSVLLICLFFYIRALKNNLALDFILGGFLAGIAFLTRQIGFLLPIGILLVLIIKSILVKKFLIKEILLTLFPTMIIIVLYYIWVSQAGVPAALQVFFTSVILKETLPIILPQEWKLLPYANNYYFELLIQRGFAYVTSLAIHLLPILFIFQLNLTKFLFFLKNHIQYITFIGIFILFGLTIDQTTGLRFIRVPHELTHHERLLLHWDFWWRKILVFSLPFWILVLAFSLKRIHDAFLIHTKFSSKKLIIFAALYLTSILVIIYNMAKIQFPSNITFKPDPINPGLLNDLVYTFNAHTPIYIWIDAIKSIWLVIIIISFIFLTIGYLITKVRLKAPKLSTLPFIMAGLLLLGHMFMSFMFTHSYWEEYTIPWIPLILILVAGLIKPVKISLLQSVLVILFVSFLSIQITRNRYQEEGVIWELGTTMVNRGIEPKTYGTTNWAWRPYWYFESGFQEVVKKYNGDKYKVRPVEFGAWPVGFDKNTVVYNPVRLQGKPNPKNEGKYILISDPFWTFDAKSFIQSIRMGVEKSSI